MTDLFETLIIAWAIVASAWALAWGIRGITVNAQLNVNRSDNRTIEDNRSVRATSLSVGNRRLFDD